MKIEDLENLAKKGKLIIHKYKKLPIVRNQYIYFDVDIDNPDFGKLKEVRKIPVQRYYYSCRSIDIDMDKHRSYKITANDFKLLLKAGAVIEE